MASQTNTRVAFLWVAGKATLLSPLSLAQQDQLAEYLRYQYMAETARQVDGLSGPLAEHVVDAAKAKADNIYPGRREHAEFVFTFPGLCYALQLAAVKHNPAFTIEDAAGALEEREGEAIEAVRKCIGYERTTGGDKPRNEPLPMAQIMRLLTNEPYCHTPAEVAAMSLEEISLIWNESDQQDRGISMQEQAEFVAEYRKKKSVEKLGIWGQESIWT
jgi:hypothetical protein